MREKNRRFNGDYKDAAILISSPLTALPDLLKIQANTFIYSLIPIWESVVSSSFVAIQTKQGMHMSPRDLNLRRQWTKFVQAKRANFVEPSKLSVIYNAHFASDCFDGGYIREMGFKKSTDLIPSAVTTIQPQTPQQQALSEVRIKRTMESDETEKTAEKSSKRSRKSRDIFVKHIIRQDIKQTVLVFKHRHFPFLFF